MGVLRDLPLLLSWLPVLVSPRRGQRAEPNLEVTGPAWRCSWLLSPYPASEPSRSGLGLSVPRGSTGAGLTLGKSKGSSSHTGLNEFP